MKKFILVITVILTLILPTTTILADSNIDNALWKGIIRITNTGPAAENISAVMPLDSDSLVANGFADDTLKDVAIQYAGDDVAFMPGYGDNPWVMWVKKIGAGQNIDYDLYTKGAVDGKIRYFPGAGGMTTDVSDTLELKNNTWEIEQKGYWDISAGADKDSVYKQDAFRLSINPWLSPTSFTDETTTWSSQTNAYDENTTTAATTSVTGIGWSNWLELNIEAINCNKVRFVCEQVWNAGNFTKIDLDAYYNGGYKHVYEGAADPENTWYEKSLGGTYTVTAVQVRFFHDAEGPHQVKLYEVDFYATDDSDQEIRASILNDTGTGDNEIIVVKATGYSSDDYTIKAAVSDGKLRLYVNESEYNEDLNGVSVPETLADWVFVQNGSMQYLEYQSITINDIPQQHIEWQYDDIFTDTENGHHAKPTFLDTSDIEAELISFSPRNQAKIGTFSLTGEQAILTGEPEAITQLYTELEFENIPGAEAANELLEAGDIPPALWWFPFIFFGIGIAGLLVYGATKLGGATGSLLTMCIVIEVLLAVIGIMNPIPFWPALLFPIPMTALILSQKHFSWG